MSVIHESVKLRDLIWEDETFAISSFVTSDLLHDSLQRLGILHPPWVWRRADGQMVIVDGFKRLRWMRLAGADAVECRVFPAKADAREVLIQRLEARLFGPPLNTAEKAQIIHKLSLHAPQQNMLDHYLPRLGVAARLVVMKKWRRLASSSEQLLEASAQGKICERAALELADWERESRWRMVSLLSELRCSASIQMEIMERVMEIALREAAGAREILEEESIQRITSNEELNHRQKTDALRNFLHARRYPRIEARERRFQQGLATLDLPQSVSILPPPGFEGKNWQLHVHFASHEELSQTLKALQDSVSSKNLLNLL